LLSRMSHARAGHRRPPSPRMPPPSSPTVGRLSGINSGVGRKTSARVALMTNSLLLPCACHTWMLLARLSGQHLHRQLGLRTQRRAQSPWRKPIPRLQGGSGVIGAGPVRPTDSVVGLRRCTLREYPHSVAWVHCRWPESRCTSASDRDVGRRCLTRPGCPIGGPTSTPMDSRLSRVIVTGDVWGERFPNATAPSCRSL
jgi:hypothetical protein